MKFEIDNIDVIYPDEDQGEQRNLEIEVDGEWLHFHFMDKKGLRPGGITLSKGQVKVLRDSLSLILKNELLD